ncbi:MAG TPA: class I SAM-dependent methyltransferase [Actinomycetospora sp.]|uniref:class I SAM-dependent methyltransferase n=1 Tax=Actinomycetospora sp. TaxID=1872135 RepID=UPI002F3E9988
MSEQTAQHYARLASTYDELWTYDPDHIRQFSRAMIDALRLIPSDAIADIGCGTGLYTRALCEDLRPARPVLCVDPTPAMLDQLPASPGLRPLLASAEDLASGHVGLPTAGPLDAVIMKESIHHVPDRRGVVAGLTSMLSRHGRILVVMLPTTISHPLFRAAHDRFEELQPEPDEIADLLAAAGLRASVSYRTFHVTVDRARYVHMLESRYMSVLDEFSESELAAGIEQFRRAYRDDPVIRFDDHFAFVTGWVRPG